MLRNAIVRNIAELGLTHRNVPFPLGSIQQLHERVTQLCAEYRDLYEKLNVPDIGPRVDWTKILDQKMVTAAAFHMYPPNPSRSDNAHGAPPAIVCSAACRDVMGLVVELTQVVWIGELSFQILKPIGGSSGSTHSD